MAVTDQTTTTSQLIREKADVLAEAVVQRMYAAQPEIWERYGEVGRAHSLQDAKYHLAYLAEALAAGDPGLFMDYAAWVKVLFTGLKLPDRAMVDTLQTTIGVLRDHLPPEHADAASEYIDRVLRGWQEAPTTVASFIDESATLGGLARRYLDALLAGDRRTASQLILDAVDAGVSVRDIYLHVFQPAQYEIGRLWQTNQVSVAQEHFCSAATQMIMSQLYPHIFATEKIGRRLVATCVGGELHEIGVRMVADFFEMEGWDSYYLGANTPVESVLRMLKERQAHAVAISATMTFHLPRVTALVQAVRESEVGGQVKILVGGYPFRVAPGLWREVGADGSALDALSAVRLANDLVAAG